MKRQASGSFRSTVTRDQLERELTMVREAIAMVAAGRAPGVTLAGLRFGQEMFAEAAAEGRNQGVVVEALWTSGEAGCDLRMSRVHA